MPQQPIIDLNSLGASLGQNPASPPPPPPLNLGSGISSSNGQMPQTPQTSIGGSNISPGSTIPAQQQPIGYPAMSMPSIINMPQQTPAQQSSPNINVTINDKAGTGSINLTTSNGSQDFTILSVLVSLLFVSAGAIILGEQLDLIQISYMNLDMVQVSALLIIFAGCLLLFKKIRVVRLLGSLVLLGSLAGVASLTFFASFGPDSSLATPRPVSIDAPSGATDLGSIQLDSIMSDVSIRSSTGQEGVRGIIKSDRPISISVSTGLVRYHEYPDRNPVQSITSSYELLHGFMPIDHLGVKQFYGSTNLDLTQAKINKITLASSISEHIINIGTGMSGSTIDIMGGWVDVSLNLPKQMGLKLEYHLARGEWFGSKDFENMSAQSDTDMRVSSNYATADSKITVRVHVIGGSVKVRQP